MKLEEIKFVDAIDGLHELENDSFDLGFADPPFNIDLEKNPNSGKIFCKSRNGKIFYQDSMDIDEYELWCKAWFSEMMRTCKKVIIYPGRMNIGLFYRINEPTDQIIYFMKFCTLITPSSWAGRYRPLLVYAKDKNLFLGRPAGENRKFDSNVIMKEKQWFDATEEEDRKKMIHPCPIDRELIYKILFQLKPKTFLDPFTGSGTTLYMARNMNIKYLGFEINKQYKQDILLLLSRNPVSYVKRDVTEL